MKCVEELTRTQVRCSRAVDGEAHCEQAQLPPTNLDAMDFFRAKAGGIWSDEIYEFLECESRIIAAVGKSGSGKTLFACGLLLVVIKDRWHAVPDKYRFFYTPAVAAMEEITRNKFNDDSDFDAVIKNAGLLILDDVDLVAERDRAALSNIVCTRSDKRKVTVLTGTDTEAISFDERMSRRILNGRVIKLA